MTSTITGKPGDGKSLFAVMLLLEVLIRTQKFVVTNIPLRLGAVQEYVSKRIKGQFDIDSRLKVIPDEEVYEFYRHRSGGLVLPWSPDKEAGEVAAKRLPRPEFIEAMKKNLLKIGEDPAFQKPVVYFIDEAHNFFSARDWATNGRGLLYYASQHRHLHDEIYLITQVLENVEKQLRGLVSETHAVRNQLRRRIGPVKMRPVFRVKSYYGVPSGLSAKPFAEMTFDLDVLGIASCYNTVGALGIHAKAEEQQNRGWLPWWTLPVGGAVAVLALVGCFAVLPSLGAMAAKKTVQAGSRLGEKMASGGQPEPVLSQKRPINDQVKTFEAMTPRKGENRLEVREEAKEKLYVRGYVRAYGRISVLLSDGRILTEADEELEAVERGWVQVSGSRIPFRAPQAGEEKKKVERASMPSLAESKLSPRDEGAWIVGDDGVSRLKEKPELVVR